MDIEWVIECVTKPLESFFFAMIYSNGARPGYLHHFLCAVAKLSKPDKVPETHPMSFFHQNMSEYRTSHDLLISLSASNDVFSFISGIMASESK